MAATSLFPYKTVLRSIKVELEDLTLDLNPALRLRVTLQWADGLTADVLCLEVNEGEWGDIPDQIRTAIDGFLWGEGASKVLAWAQKLDHSANSKRVRRSVVDYR